MKQKTVRSSERSKRSLALTAERARLKEGKRREREKASSFLLVFTQSVG